MSVVAAGVETTRWALTVGCYHILANVAIEQRLRSELEHAIPDSTRMISVPELEKLPYSTAVIQEKWHTDCANGTTPLGHRMVAFSKGTRMCIGINMAYAELYIGLATMFRRHLFKLYETDRTDVEFSIDMITPQPKLNSKGVRVLVE
ncbi:unnamed protein product [Clonostachys solani]|uniref:Cytochrome P450 n=1 Tax=Clonostachys solani TaxID=160281 RepID=A0A9N9YYQ9_9HYPO|nr:unnamed protein product [Clonostachys solani]